MRNPLEDRTEPSTLIKKVIPQFLRFNKERLHRDERVTVFKLVTEFDLEFLYRVSKLCPPGHENLQYIRAVVGRKEGPFHCGWCGRYLSYNNICTECRKIPEAVRWDLDRRGQLISNTKASWTEEKKSQVGAKLRAKIASASDQEKTLLALGRKRRAVKQWAERTEEQRKSIARKFSNTVMNKPPEAREASFLRGQESSNVRKQVKLGKRCVLLQGSYEPIVAKDLHSKGFSVSNCDFSTLLEKNDLKRIGKNSITYRASDGLVRRYFPDMMVKKDDRLRIVEVKSLFYLLRDLENNLRKFKRAIEFSRIFGLAEFILAVVIDGTPLYLPSPDRRKILKFISENGLPMSY